MYQLVYNIVHNHNVLNNYKEIKKIMNISPKNINLYLINRLYVHLGIHTLSFDVENIFRRYSKKTSHI